MSATVLLTICVCSLRGPTGSVCRLQRQGSRRPRSDASPLRVAQVQRSSRWASGGSLAGRGPRRRRRSMTVACRKSCARASVLRFRDDMLPVRHDEWPLSGGRFVGHGASAVRSALPSKRHEQLFPDQRAVSPGPAAERHRVPHRARAPVAGAAGRGRGWRHGRCRPRRIGRRCFAGCVCGRWPPRGERDGADRHDLGPPGAHRL